MRDETNRYDLGMSPNTVRIVLLAIIAVVTLALVGVTMACVVSAKDTAHAALSVSIVALVVAMLTLGATAYIIVLELRSAKSRRRAAIAWRILDECMRDGYTRMKAPTVDSTWEWHRRLAIFCRVALGHHAKELILAEVRTRETVEELSRELSQLIARTLTRIHLHLTDKVADGRIHPDFDESLWEGWEPVTETPITTPLE